MLRCKHLGKGLGAHRQNCPLKILYKIVTNPIGFRYKSDIKNGKHRIKSGLPIGFVSGKFEENIFTFSAVEKI
jgi:hypothetical protein